MKFNWDAMPITDVLTVFSSKDFLGFNYLLDPTVKGTVTIYFDTQMTRRELWQILEQMLWTCNAYCPPEGDLLKIVQFKNMPKEPKVNIKNSPISNVQLMLVPISNSTAKNIMEMIKPFLTDGATVMSLPTQNSILLVETPANIPKLQSLIEMLDQNEKDGWSQVAIPCVNAGAPTIKTEPATLLPVLGFPVTVSDQGAQKGVAEPGAIHLTSLDRLQVIVASAANVEAIEEIKKWVAILDRADIGEQDRVFVYKCINNQAEHLLDALNSIFTIQGFKMSSAASSSGGQQGGAAKAATTTAAPSVPAPPQGAKKTNLENTTTTSVFEVPSKVLADGVNNRLIVRTTSRAYAMIKAVLDRLDTVPKQVLLQVLVAEVTLTNSTQFGVEWADNQNINTGGGNRANQQFGTNYRDLNPGPVNGSGDGSDYGLKYWLTDSDDPSKTFAYLRAVAGENNLKVLSCPQIITISHNTAHVKVGDKVPLLTGQNQQQNTTNVFNEIKYQDTGIITDITPHVTEGGLITMEVKQTLSDAIPNTTSKIDSPVIQERLFETSLAVRDGNTLVVGGLILERDIESRTNVPFVINVPVIGNFLGSNDVQKRRIEILCLITATVITEKSDIEMMIERYKSSMERIKKFNESISND